MKIPPEKTASHWEAWLAARAPKSEHALQVALVNWCRSLAIRDIVRGRFAAIPNGAFLAGNPARRAGQMAKLKAEGLMPGFPDMVFWRGAVDTLAHAGEVPQVLWLELKNGSKGVISPAQKEVHASLTGSGFRVVVARTLENATREILDFYKP